MPAPVAERIAANLALDPEQVAAAVALLDEGASIAFIATYRASATAGLGVAQLRELEQRLYTLRELDTRREVLRERIEARGLMSEALESLLADAQTFEALDDIALAFQDRRDSKAQAAVDAGLQALADALWNGALPGNAQTTDVQYDDPARLAFNYIDAGRGIEDTQQALDGARHILMQRIEEEAALIGRLRSWLWKNASLVSTVSPAFADQKKGKVLKYSDYFEFSQRVKKIPAFRVLSLFKGRKDGILRLELAIATTEDGRSVCEAMIGEYYGFDGEPGSRSGRVAEWMQETVRHAWRVRILPRLDVQIKDRIRERAEDSAIRDSADKFRELLMAAPAGPRITMGIAPGLGNGVRLCVIDAEGAVLETGTVFPHPPQREWDEAIEEAVAMIRRHGADLLGHGSGKGSRETEAWVTELIKRHPELRLQKMSVNEAGVGSYASSRLGEQELPELEPRDRATVSIARRLQDPLAELLKIDPMSMDLGSHQDALDAGKLAQALEDVIDDSVNAVALAGGVDVNRAGSLVLSHVSGLNRALAARLVETRETQGYFRNRKALQSVPRFSAQVFEWAAGFLRVLDGDEPLDRSAVHPAEYALVRRIAEASGHSVEALCGNAGLVDSITAEAFVDEQFGLPDVQAVLARLGQSGKDPRGTFPVPVFQDVISSIKDLKPGMILEGVVATVTDFGAFVDIGVHADGLIHVSALSDEFVETASELVKPGDAVTVKVLQIDLDKQRVALTLRLEDELPMAQGGETQQIEGIRAGMLVDGKVSSVSGFGAFVDLGIKIDGLVHVSAMSDEFVKDPADVVKIGEQVKARVIEVDVKRQRIALSLRLDDKPRSVRQPGASASGEARRGSGAGSRAAGDARKRTAPRAGSDFKRRSAKPGKKMPVGANRQSAKCDSAGASGTAPGPWKQAAEGAGTDRKARLASNESRRQGASKHAVKRPDKAGGGRARASTGMASAFANAARASGSKAAGGRDTESKRSAKTAEKPSRGKGKKPGADRGGGSVWEQARAKRRGSKK